MLASGLSFLGVGIQPPTADWGIMTADGRTVLREAPHVATIPGITIVVVALAFNVAGDGIRDALDPAPAHGLNDDGRRARERSGSRRRRGFLDPRRRARRRRPSGAKRRGLLRARVLDPAGGPAERS